MDKRVTPRDLDISFLEQRIKTLQREQQKLDRIEKEDLGFRRPYELIDNLIISRELLGVSQEEESDFWGEIRKIALDREIDDFSAGAVLRLVYETLGAAVYTGACRETAEACKNEEVLRLTKKILLQMPEKAMTKVKQRRGIAYIQQACDSMPDFELSRIGHLCNYFP